MNNHPVERLNLILSILVSLYFTGMILLSFCTAGGNRYINIILELFTIPSLLILLYLFVFGGIRIISGRLSKILLISLIISILTIVMLIFATIKQPSA